MAEVKTVKVQCIWPAERGAKNDCRGGTNVVWAGHGDVQDYPAHLWPRLAAHPDVWRLYDPEADARVAAAKQAAEAAQAEALRVAQEAERIQREEEARLAAEAQAAAAEREKAAGNGTDLAVVTSVNPPVLTAEDLEKLSDDEVRAEAEKREYGLHPRLNSENLRKRFLEAQANTPTADSEGGEG